MRTMQESKDRAQRRLALVARELARLDFDIAALSEVRFAEQGSLREDGAGPLLVWEEQGRAPPLWCRHHGQNFHRQKIAELSRWSFRPHHACP